jgi:hypothetical protein
MSVFLREFGDDGILGSCRTPVVSLLYLLE